MGYTTILDGVFKCSKPLLPEQIKQINNPPSRKDNPTVPFDDSQWEVSEDGRYIEWMDDGGRSTAYLEWLDFICELLKGWGVTLSGTVTWDGEESGDIGRIKCKALADGSTKVSVILPKWESESESE